MVQRRILYHIFVDRFNNGNRSGKVDNPKKIVSYMEIGKIYLCT